MKKLLSTVFALLAISQHLFLMAQNSVNFYSPTRGQIITENERLDYPAALQILDYDPSFYYWVAITLPFNVSISDENNILQNQKMQDLLFSKWQIGAFWPKFWAQDSIWEGRIYDGGKNPNKGVRHQPAILFVVKVDQRLNQKFTNYLNGGVWQPIPKSELNGSVIVGRVEFFYE